jgi:GMP synthase (glutamine-hydrolysing)
MRTPRLASELFVRSCVRRADLENIAVVVSRRGDPTSGAILIKLNRFDQGCCVLAESVGPDGGRAWIRGTGTAPVDEPAADAYIARQRGRDPDLWVVEIEDRAGRLPFDAVIVGG